MNLRIEKISRELQREKNQLTSRLAQIEQALQALNGLISPDKPVIERRVTRGPRIKNERRLKDVVDEVLVKGPMTAKEIIRAVKKTGYRFRTRKPLYSLSWIIYKKDAYERFPGHRFGLKKT